MRIEYLSLKGRGRGREEGKRDRESRRWEEGKVDCVAQVDEATLSRPVVTIPSPPSLSLSPSPFMPIIDSMTSLDCSFSSLTTNFTPSLLFFASTFPSLSIPFRRVVVSAGDRSTTPNLSFSNHSLHGRRRGIVVVEMHHLRVVKAQDGQTSEESLDEVIEWSSECENE